MLTPVNDRHKRVILTSTNAPMHSVWTAWCHIYLLLLLRQPHASSGLYE